MTPTPPKAQRGALESLGSWTALNPLKVLAIWLILLVLAGYSSGNFASRMGAQTNVVDGSDSAKANQLIREAFPNTPDETDFVVLHSDTLTAPEPEFRAQVTASLDRFRGQPGVRAVTDPGTRPELLVSADGHTALIVVSLDGEVKDLQKAATPLQELARGLTTSRMQVYFTGLSPLAAATIKQADEDLGRAESIGFPVAALILLIAFGSVVAAAIPLALGGTAILASFGLLGIAAFFLQFSTIARSSVTMLAIALGIDYSLFIITRFREELASTAARTRGGRAEAIGRALSTAGRAVLFSGTTVMISLAGLFLVRSPGVRAMAVGMMVGVAAMMILSMTLLPAILGLLGARVNSLALPWARGSLAHPDPEHSRWAKLTGMVMRRPVIVALGVTILLGALATPTLGLRFGVDTGAGATKDTPAGRGFTMLSGSFAPGMVAPISIVVTSKQGALSDDQLDAVAAFTRSESHDARVATISSATSILDQQLGGHSARLLRAALTQAPEAFGSVVNERADTTVLTVYPAHAVDTTQTQTLVGQLRADAARTLRDARLTTYVGGSPAQIADMMTENSRATPLVIGAVLAASWLLLLLAFRSLVLPFKAIAVNLLSVGAAFGIVVLVFQDGHGAGLLGVDRAGFIQLMLPLLTFAIAFGLSMDYEVFMVSRMREEWNRTGDNPAAVRLGITHTARVITSAALIMVAVFASFMLAGMLETKQLGFMLSVTVLLDATVVRLFLVPALMRIIGRWNWWMPRWSKRPPAMNAPRLAEDATTVGDPHL